MTNPQNISPGQIIQEMMQTRARILIVVPRQRIQDIATGVMDEIMLNPYEGIGPHLNLNDHLVQAARNLRGPNFA